MYNTGGNSISSIGIIEWKVLSSKVDLMFSILKGILSGYQVSIPESNMKNSVISF